MGLKHLVNWMSAEANRTLAAAVNYRPERYCFDCLWCREYPGRHVCFYGGEVGRTIKEDEDVTFCENYEEAIKE